MRREAEMSPMDGHELNLSVMVGCEIICFGGPHAATLLGLAFAARSHRGTFALCRTIRR